MDRQSRIALLLISVLALYLVHTWHVKSASDDVSSLSTPSPVVHPPSILDPTQESSYAAAAPAPTEYVDAEANRWAAADEHMLENDMVKNEYVDYSTKPTIAKVSMLYGANPKPAYVRALRSHRIHNERFNYGMFVLTEDAVGGFWNKPIYLLSLIMQELSKPPAERLQWLMYVVDPIVMSPLTSPKVGRCRSDTHQSEYSSREFSSACRSSRLHPFHRWSRSKRTQYRHLFPQGLRLVSPHA